jgi:hypothetical protein
MKCSCRWPQTVDRSEEGDCYVCLCGGEIEEEPSMDMIDLNEEAPRQRLVEEAWRKHARSGNFLPL